MAKLEEDKPKLNITSEDAQICEAFAVTVFNRADKQDRSGHADLNTVKAFYVATVFIDVRTGSSPCIQFPIQKLVESCKNSRLLDSSCLWCGPKQKHCDIMIWNVNPQWQWPVTCQPVCTTSCPPPTKLHFRASMDTIACAADPEAVW